MRRPAGIGTSPVGYYLSSSHRHGWLELCASREILWRSTHEAHWTARVHSNRDLGKPRLGIAPTRECGCGICPAAITSSLLLAAWADGPADFRCLVRCGPSLQRPGGPRPACLR